MCSRPDGWWPDPVGAARRLVAEINLMGAHLHMNSSSDNHSSAPSHRLHRNGTFWIMFSVAIVPFLFFFLTSYVQLYSILGDINTPIVSQAQRILDNEEQFTDDYSLAKSMTKARIALERDVVLYRHERASAALATRTWMRFMSLIFGASLVVTGSVFVLGRVTAPKTDGNLQWRDIRMELASRSPGLFLVIFGCTLIAIPNLSTQSIDVDDTSTYVQKIQQMVSHGELDISNEKLTPEQLEQSKKK